MRNHLDAHYRMIADIEFTEEDFAEGGDFYNSGKCWTPIGNDADNPFTGVLNGNGYKINGLKVNASSESDLYIGLIGYCQGTVKNLSSLDTSIFGTVNDEASILRAGGICGYLGAGTISNCTVSGEINAHEACVAKVDKGISFAGGIVGESSNGSIDICVNTADITAIADAPTQSENGSTHGSSSQAGGIVAKTTGVISASYNTGKIVATTGINGIYSNAGGITASSNNDISMCYNTGVVQALGNPNNNAGGIAAGFSKATISNCYNTGYIMADGNVAGIVGYLSSGTVANVYNVGEVSGNSTHCVCAIIAYANSGTIINGYYTNTIISGVGKMTDTSTRISYEDAQKQSSYSGFDFDDVWSMCGLTDHPFPELQVINHTTVPQPENTTEFAGGTGSYLNPYKVGTKEHLNHVRNYPSAHFVMTNDITFLPEDFDENGAFYNNSESWIPIGTESIPFSGNFDGNGNVIIGIKVNVVLERGEVVAGLFGYSKGSIHDLGLVDSNISVAITTTSTNYVCLPYAGGIVGYNEGTIERCYNTGAISAFCQPSQVHAGGIAGHSSGYISNCFNTGDVLAQTGNTSYHAYAGGIAGQTSYRFSSEYAYSIENCYNIGNVKTVGGHSSIGGISSNCSSSRMKGCYYLDNVEGSDSAMRCTTSQMALADTFAGFDFDSVWTIGQSSYPYPELRGNRHIYDPQYAPIAEIIQPDSITLKSYDGYEYGIYKAGYIVWQSDCVFDNLIPGTEYCFYQRKAATETAPASECSSWIRITTPFKSSPAKPDHPILSCVNATSVILTAHDGYEYSMDGINWKTSSIFTQLQPGTSYTFYQRVSETNISYASECSEGLIVTTLPLKTNEPSLTSFQLPEAAVTGQALTIQATTNIDTAKIAVYNEHGLRINLQSVSYVVIDGQKVWTAKMYIVSKGEREFAAYAISKHGMKSEALTGCITITSPV